MTNKEILTLEPQELYDWLMDEYYITIPEEIASIEDMKVANKLNLKLAAFESFLSTLLSQVELYVRDTKRNSSKEEYQDMLDRKKLVFTFNELVKHQREALSRSFTIYTKTLEELRISDFSNRTGKKGGFYE